MGILGAELDNLKTDYSSETTFTTNKRLVLTFSGLGFILINGLTYKPAVRLAKRTGLRGFWPVNLATLGCMGMLNCVGLGVLIGWTMSQDFERELDKQGVPKDVPC